MAEKTKKVRVGVFAVGAVALVATVLAVFGGMKFWEKHDTYYVVVDDSVIGLESAAQVLHNGIRVGSVTAMATMPDDLTRVRVTIEVQPGLPIKADTQASLRFLGITGLKIIDLRGGTATGPRLPPGSVIVNGETLLDQFERQAKELMDQSAELMKRANTVLDQSQVVVANLAELTDPAQFQGMGQIMASTRLAAGNLARATGALNAMVGENRVAVRQSLATVDRIATGTAELVSDVTGMVRDNKTQISSVVSDIRQASRSFRELARDLRQKPSRLLYSSAAKDRKMP